MFFADLHLHSKYSRATGRDADLEHLALWARRKGVAVLGTGDFTHPQWLAEIREKLLPAEPGLFRLRDDLEREVERQVATADPAGTPATRFMLQVEISTIYKKGDRTRKVHHLIYVPSLESAARLIQQLAKIGNLNSDGRPILGLDSRHLLEITLASGEGCYLVPAHIWTPWFAVLGSKSGFDSIEDCYGDLTPEIFALETGLSSDPAMNWRLSQLDRFTLVSNSDAHSPQKLGREACAFETPLDYFAIRQTLVTRQGYAGTVEFFPEEGKYHLDGHRKCGVRLEPEETRQAAGRCPVCAKALTIGVMNRVAELADQPAGRRPPAAPAYRSLIPLPEVLAELRGVGPQSRRVQDAYQELLRRVGPELFILQEAACEEIRRAGQPLLAEAIRRMRSGQVICEAGYDGEYGVIHLFEPQELLRSQGVSLLFDLPPEEPGQGILSDPPCAAAEDGEAYQTSAAGECQAVELAAKVAGEAGIPTPDTVTGRWPLLADLDDEQRTAAQIARGPLLIVAGPGTGKTRTLTHRIAHLVRDLGIPAEQCLAITFSRRAATEMAQRLALLLPAHPLPPVMTFHALGLSILRERAAEVGLPDSFGVAGQQECLMLLVQHLGLSETQAKRLLREASPRHAADPSAPFPAEPSADVVRYRRLLRQQNCVDFDELILLPTQLLEDRPDLAGEYRRRWPWVSVDEYQDLDDAQYRLVRQLVAADGNLCAIGDPDQSIYGFRGANPQVFLQFERDFPGARVVHLQRNYRSSQTIVAAAVQAIAPSSLVANRTLESLSENAERIHIEHCATERAEAEFVVHTIERLIGGSTFFSLDSGRVAGHEGDALSFADFAVLYRTEAQAAALVEGLARSGIPFQQRSHRRLSDEPAVQALVRQLREFAVGSPQRPRGPVTDLLKQAADAVWGSHPEIADQLPDLFPLAQRSGENLDAFLVELTLAAAVDLWDPRADRVSLLTLHASKGLEFPVVFLPGCEDGLLPLSWGDGQDTDVAEERRLFFVGLTRARDRLILSHAAKRLWRGRLREMAPSPFLAALQDKLLERGRRHSRGKAKTSADRQLELF